jgi:hypothetical protein
VIIPDPSVPGGWLCNHSCNPNAVLYASGEARVRCLRAIAPGEEVTIFYGWVSSNEPERDPCLCGAESCRGFINFDVSTHDAAHFDADTPAGEAVRARLDEYAAYLRSIDQAQVLDIIGDRLRELRAKLRE